MRVVEFLDFGCDARAAFPIFACLRAECVVQVDLVARSLPRSGYAKAEPAAVEAAARQGRLEQTNQIVYETRGSWGDQQVPHAATFHAVAERLGLDMAAYDRDVADPGVRARVLGDREDGTSVGVQGTPTSFVNHRAVDGSYPALKAALDQALGAS